MISGRDLEHLDDILRHAEEAVQLLADLDTSSLANDRRTFLAVSYDLLVIGEAAGRVSLALRGRLSAIPWERIVGMRNRLAHGYDEIDVNVVVDTIRNKLPALISELRRTLSDAAQ